MFLARVFISYKPTINDPEGQTIHGSLHQLGFDSVRSVRAGKYMEIALNDERKADAARKVTEMCEQLLANPLIEDYSFELAEVGRE
jgi:phosphoribosylformylglycinamidine synthase